MGEMQHSVEQNAVFDPPARHATGLIHGFDQSVYRHRAGRLSDRHFPGRQPADANQLRAETHSARERLIRTATIRDCRLSRTFQTDTYTGFSGGDIVPFIPGSRFSVFDKLNGGPA